MVTSSQINREFARRLQAKLIEKGWNQSDLARHAARFSTKGKFGRDLVSKYLKGATTPTPLYLDALARAFGCQPEDLYPDVNMALSKVTDADAPLSLRVEGDFAWLRINQRVPYPVALKIVALLDPKGS